MSAKFEVHALSAGGRTTDWSTRLYLEPIGQTTAAYFMWLIRGAGGPILVDTGFTMRLGKLKGIPVEGFKTRDDLLTTAGIDPREIATVILTHLHWDHFDLEGFLPKATFWVQRREVDFWSGDASRERWLQRFVSDAFVQDLEALRSSGRLKVIDGSLDLLEGYAWSLLGGTLLGCRLSSCSR
jgi:glyoxylase-like metal-dependent hydrolase (beta-lactamase superfamily II)